MLEPNHFISADKKDKTWLLNAVRYLYDSYMSFNTNIGFINTRLNRDNPYKIWQSYAVGNFDTNQFKPILGCDELDDKVARLIDWKTLPYMAQKIDVIRGKMMELGYNINATAINPEADAEKLNVKYLMEFSLLVKDIFPELKPSEEEPQTFEEIEMFMKDYKLGAEIASETAWNCIAYANGIEDIITQAIWDLLVCGIFGFRDYIEGGHVKVRRINPENFVFGYTEKQNLSDCSQFGEVLYLSLNEIVLQDNGKNLTQTDIEALKKQFPNSDKTNVIDKFNYKENYGIPVLDFSIESVNERVWETDENQNTIKEKDPNEKAGDSSDFSKKEIRKKFKVYYTGKWIIGTDFLYNYGLETNIKRSKNSITDALPSWHLYAPTIKDMHIYSLVQRCIPLINNIHIAWYQQQYMIAKSRPRGLAIAVDSIQNVGIKNNNPLEVIDTFQKEGHLLYNSVNDSGQLTNGGRDPIRELEGGLPRDFQLYSNIISNNLEMMNRVIGLNDFTDASNPNANTGKAIAMQAVTSSNNALQPLYNAYSSVITRVAVSSIMRYQDLHPEGKNDYVSAIGTGTVKYFEVTKDISLYDMGIKFSPNPDEEEINLIRSQIANELAIRSQGGQGGLMVEDALAINDALKVSPKRAAQILTIRRKKNERDAQAIAQQNAQQNAEMQNAPLQFKAQMEQAKIEAKMQMQQMTLDFQAQMLQMKEQALTQRELQLQEMKNQNNKEITYMKSEGKSSEIAMQGEIDGNLIELEYVLKDKEEDDKEDDKEEK